MVETLFLLWLGILPLVVWKGTYEGPKVVWFLAGGLFLVLFWIVRILKSNQNIKLSKIDLVYFLWLALLLVSSILNQRIDSLTVGESYRHQGVIFFLVLWIVGKTIQILRGEGKRKLNRVIGIVAIIESLIVLFQFLSGKLYFGKPLGTLGEANAVGGFLAVSSYFLFETLPKGYLIFPLIAILITQSRSGFLSALPIVIVHLKKIYLLLVVAFSIFTIVFISLRKTDSVFENRPLIWKLGIEAVTKKPILGYGTESGQAVYDNAFKKMSIPLSGLVIDRSHNLFLDVAMWSGVIGLIPFCWWLFLAYKNLKDKRKYAFYSFLIYSMLQPLSVVHWILLIVILNTRNYVSSRA